MSVLKTFPFWHFYLSSLNMSLLQARSGNATPSNMDDQEIFAVIRDDAGSGER